MRLFLLVLRHCVAIFGTPGYKIWWGLVKVFPVPSPFLACLYVSHRVKRAFVGEPRRLVLTTQLLLSWLFFELQVSSGSRNGCSHCSSLSGNNSHAIHWTEAALLLLLFKVSNDNVRPQHRTATQLGSFGNVCGYYSVCKVHQKKSWLTGCNGS